MSTQTRHHVSRRAGAFTLVELLLSVAVIAVLVGLLIVGFRSTRAFARSVTDRAAATNVREAVSKFTQEFGFAPPLVRDQHPTTPEWVEGTTTRRIAVYAITDPADLLILRPVNIALPGSANPFEDRRFSERTLPYYLAGGCSVRYYGVGSAPTPEVAELTVDGVIGPGFYKPRSDGSFEIPPDVLDPSRGGRRTAAQSTSRAGAKYDSFVNLDSRSLTLFFTSDNPGNDLREVVELRDSKGVAMRYYRWVNPDDVTRVEDFRLPPLVGRDGQAFTQPTPDERDLRKNPQLRDAVFAVVAAGPDGAFGDEPEALLFQRLNRPLPTGGGAADAILKARFDAERDNIVEVGR
jgi:type II secretory pathway pseudopilin PulG